MRNTGPVWGMAVAVGDQALISASNFLTAVIAARALGPADFGTFTLLWTSVLVVQGFSAALISQPLRVLGVGRIDAPSEPYGGAVSTLQAGLASITAAIGLAALLLSDLTSTVTALVFAVCVAGMQVQEYLRARKQTRLDAWGLLAVGALTHVPRLVAIVALVAAGKASVAGLLGAIALGYVVVIASYVSRAWPATATRAALMATLREHWNYGRWLLVESLAFIASNQLYIYLVALWLGTTEAGGLAAVQGLLNVTNVLLFAVVGYATPLARRRFLVPAGPSWQSLLWKVGSGLLVLLLLFVVTLVLAGDLAIRLLFGAEYDRFVYLLPVLGVATVLNAVNALLATGFRVVGRPQVGFVAKVASGVLTCAAAYPLLTYLGTLGAAVGALLTQATWLVVYLYYSLGSRHGYEPAASRDQP